APAAGHAGKGELLGPGLSGLRRGDVDGLRSGGGAVAGGAHGASFRWLRPEGQALLCWLVGARRAGARSSRRRSCALSATTTVEADIRIAPTDMGSTNPIGARTPAASGTAARL